MGYVRSKYIQFYVTKLYKQFTKYFEPVFHFSQNMSLSCHEIKYQMILSVSAMNVNLITDISGIRLKTYIFR